METLIVVLAFVIGLAFGIVIARAKASVRKYDGNLEISAEDARTIHTLEIITDPDDLKNQESVLFKIVRVPASKE